MNGWDDLLQDMKNTADDNCKEDENECPPEEPDCDDDDDDDDDDGNNQPDVDDNYGPSGSGYGTSSGSWSRGTRPLIDPQGYAYEGVPSNRVAGATAIVYFKQVDEDQNGTPVEQAVQWDAAAYGQVNPQVTGADGMYQWDVPVGLWQVRVTKDGYETAVSEWLPVPPPQLDVNLELKQNTQPEVKSATAYDEGINIEFDKFMKPLLLTTDNISVTQNGEAVSGSIELLNEEDNGQGKTLASKVRFVPATPFTARKVTLNIAQPVQSYTGLTLAEDYEQELTIDREVKELKSDSLVKVAYGGSYTIHLKALPAEAAEGRTVTVTTTSADIASVSEATVTLDAQGEAQVDVTGRLLGAGSVRFTLDDQPDLTSTTLVRVVKEQPAEAEVPAASILTESTVEQGTSVELTCATEGATIWYTLDGTCPCTSDTRIKYEAPIVLNTVGDVTLRVMAEADGMADSQVATYVYHVTVATGISDASLQDKDEDTKNKVTHDLKGQRVSEATQKGVYIVDGTKVVVK